MRHLLAVGQGKVVIVFNLYGWTGLHCDPVAAQRSSGALSAIFGEAQAQGDDSALVVGDFNADIADLPPLVEALSASWTDLGSCQAWAPAGPLLTCFALPSSPGTRRDFMICSAKLLPFVAGFRDYFHPAILTHAVLGVAIRVRSVGAVVLSHHAPHAALSYPPGIRLSKSSRSERLRMMPFRQSWSSRCPTFIDGWMSQPIMLVTSGSTSLSLRSMAS